jgi:hypothetical protein
MKINLISFFKKVPSLLQENTKLILIVLFLLITLFPPFNWVYVNKEFYKEIDNEHDFLLQTPKTYEFIFSYNKKYFLLAHQTYQVDERDRNLTEDDTIWGKIINTKIGFYKYYNSNFELVDGNYIIWKIKKPMYYLLERELIFSQLILEYITAILLVYLLNWVLTKQWRKEKTQ